ncbi:MAG TPA: NADPH:quinone oxidoreductase family protein [Solirubrobacteraceae bacterium]|jgi:NADPH2:quinone reductase|nr:NADPH:quinone oxidoreductase family protein [Solirubrobacteraceae bacterium]
MRAVQISELSGPAGVRLVDAPEPVAAHMLTPGEGVLVEVAAAGVSFPEVLQTRGLYQLKPDLPFIPGAEVGGTVLSAPASSGLQPGDRVMAFTGLGGMAERAVAPAYMTFPLPDSLDFAQGASVILNYHTVYFALKLRGRLQAGESVLVHGAAGGVGTAALQVAKALGASTIAVVSSDEKERVAREAGADEVVRSDGPWREQATELSGGGVDLVLDPVGGDRFTDSLRSLKEEGRVIVVGFTEGSIPEVKVNRLLLRNVSVVGAGWGAFALLNPERNRAAGEGVRKMIDEGFVKPIIGACLPLQQAGDALRMIDERRALGKVVLSVD